MSDGPFRSLPMSRKWRKAAEFAENPVSYSSDISDAAVLALISDCRKGITDKLVKDILNIFETPSMFTEYQFDALRRKYIENPLSNTLLDFLDKAVFNGLSGEKALGKALTDTVIYKSDCALRQIQEHYIRKSNTQFAWDVNQTLFKGLSALGFEKIAARILNSDFKAIPKISKRTSLDDGVEL